MFVTRKVWIKYRNPADGEGNDLGGGGEGGEKPADGGEKPGEKAGEKPADGSEKPGESKPGEKKPTDEEARLLKENMKRKAELQKTQEELANMKKMFEGIDPELVRKMLAEQKSNEEKQLEAKGDYERLKQRMAEEHAKEKKELMERIGALEGELGKTKGTVNELSIGSQFGQSKFISEELTLTPAKARVIYADHFDLEDGKVVGYDKPRGAANRTALVDSYGNPVGFDDALRKIVEADPEKDHLLKSKVKPGASSDSKKPSGAPAKESEPASSVSRIAAGLKGLKVS